MAAAIGKEGKRQFVHLSFGILLVFLIEIGLIEAIGAEIPFLPFNPIARSLLIITLIGLLVSFLCRHYWIPFFSHCLRMLEREEVREKLPGKGTILASVGIFLTTVFFDQTTVKASILILAIGDSVSNIAGKWFGKTNLPHNTTKTLEGSLTGFLLSSFAVMIYFSPKIAVAASFVGMIVESISQPLDDNLFIPITTAVVISLL